MAVELPAPSFSQPISSGSGFSFGDGVQLFSQGLSLGNSILGTNSAINQINRGLDMQLGAFAVQAEAYRNNAATAQSVAKYNQSLEILNTNRNLDSLSRTIRKTISSQRVQAISQGISSGSKSSLLVMADTLNNFNRQQVNLKADSRIRQQQIQFNADLESYNFENQARAQEAQARAAEYQARVAKSEAKKSRNNSILGFGISAATSLLGGLF